MPHSRTSEASNEKSTRRGPLGRALRAALAILALVLCAAAIANAYFWSTTQKELASFLATAGPKLPPTAAADVRREPDPFRARIQAARVMFAAELDAAIEVRPPKEIAASNQRLLATDGLAREALGRRPAAWDAALVAGGALFLARLQAEDDRILTAYREWEAPLEAALELGPGRVEPIRIAAVAYLRLWPTLSPAKQQRAAALTERALGDADGYRQLLPRWVEVAPNREFLFAHVPAKPEVLGYLEVFYMSRRDWAGAAEARERRRRSLGQALGEALTEAARLLDAGDIAAARTRYHDIAVQAVGSSHDFDILERALASCPPGPADAPTRQALAGALGAVVDRCRYGSCPFSRPVLKRLSRLAGEAEPPLAAQVALLAGDLDRAAELERMTETERGNVWTASWAPYLIAKAEDAAARGDGSRAWEAITALPASEMNRPTALRALASTAAARKDAATEGIARARLAAYAATSWAPNAWSLVGGRHRQEIVLDRAARGFDIEIASTAETGAIAELWVDGTVLGTFPAEAGRTLTLRAPLAAGLHLIEVVPVGGQVVPGSLHRLDT